MRQHIAGVYCERISSRVCIRLTRSRSLKSPRHVNGNSIELELASSDGRGERDKDRPKYSNSLAHLWLPRLQSLIGCRSAALECSEIERYETTEDAAKGGRQEYPQARLDRRDISASTWFHGSNPVSTVVAKRLCHSEVVAQISECRSVRASASIYAAVDAKQVARRIAKPEKKRIT